SYGMSKAMTQRLIKLLASDVDFQSRLSPADRIEVLFSQPDGDDQTSDSSELLYVSATFGGQTRNFYRFQMQDGGTDYFDEDGSSAEQFLLRNPLPAGKFRSGFGARRHPGLATGPHLHYELIVNGTKVDPMRVRLPVGKVLKGDDLVAFKRERERIDELLKQEDSDSLKVASAKIDG
ncbi:MAG: hypothetical protein E5Y29_25615, partial [Mesorhizobium sp.]